MAELSLADQDLRGLLARAIAKRGHAPPLADLVEAAGATIPEVEAALQRLNDAHALLLHPHRCEPWAVHPFALSPSSCWVETAERGYWANCLYCGFGIAAALKSDARLTTRFGGEGRTACFRVEEALWRFAADWYGAYLQEPWRKRSPEQVRTLLESHGLTGEFWSS